jgi:class 3 adenylate cyclase
VQPSGTFTFLFTDMEDSSRAWLRDQRAMGAATARHDELIEHRVAQHGGHVVRPPGEGDSRFAVFARASDAVAAACAIQVDFQVERWSIERPLRIRIAVHTGEADKRLGDYYGPAVNQCAALRSIAYGGQVLLSNITAELVRGTLPADASLKPVGLHLLKGLEEPERIWQLAHPRLPLEFLPPRSRDVQLHNPPSQLSSFLG